MTWIKTASGRRIDFSSPAADQLDIRDIALALSRNHRFAGHSPLKIGQHILEVVALMLNRAITDYDVASDAHATLAEIGLVGLLHDFPEFAVCDAATPLKRMLNPAYSDIEDRLLGVMLQKWELEEAYGRWLKLLKECDQIAVEQEALRYRLDGLFITEEVDPQTMVFIAEDREHEWVKHQEIILNDDVWEQPFVESALTVTFLRFMHLSGRGHLLPAYIEVFPDFVEWLSSTGPDNNIPNILRGRQRSLL